MKIELLDYTKNPEVIIGQMAGICYGKENSDEATCVKRAAHCVSKGHLSTLRFAYATFHISGISRVCSHQFVRSKHLDFLQRSQRYCNEQEAKVYEPENMTSQQAGDFHYAVEKAKDAYDMLVAQGMKKEDARMILPQCTTTELIVTGNYQAWLDFIRLRATKEAQKEIRDVAIEIKAQLAQLAPNIFGGHNG